MEISKNAIEKIARYDIMDLAKIGGVTGEVTVPGLADGYLRMIRDETLAAVEDYPDGYATPDAGELADNAMESVTFAATVDDAWKIFHELQLWRTKAGDDAVQMHTTEYLSPLAESVLECFARDLSHKLAQELLA